ncbi:hypothetical protein Bca4012_056174 [Brassica carinata]
MQTVTCVVPGSYSVGLNWYENLEFFFFNLSTGTLATTTQGRIESDFETIADFLMKAAHITSAFRRKHGKPHKKFVKSLCTSKDICEIRN